jgi:serine/threonine protein kinase
MTAVEADPGAGLLDGRFRLGECVGEGGMARVYRGEDVELGRTVAIKLIRPGIDGASSERARSEVAVLASLNHPSLVTLFDARLVPGQPEYLVMEFVDGPTLAAQLASGALPREAVADLAADLAEALHVVHSAGVVHRDIKPSNILLSPAQLPGGRPRAKLGDFGIAHLLDASRMTSPGLVIGTVAYLAPEQLRGAEPAAAADIYSLGLVLLEALTGQRAQPQAAGMAVALSRLENPTSIPASVDRDWAGLLERMLAPESTARPTAAEVAMAASRLAEPGQSSPAPATAATVPASLASAQAVTSGPATGAGDTLTHTRVLPFPSTPAADPGRRGRYGRLAAVGAALAAVVTVVAVVIGFSNMNAPGQVPAPVTTVPGVTEPSESPAPTQDDDSDDEEVVDDQRGKSEEDQKKTEQEQKKLDEEQRKEGEGSKKDQ